MVETPLQSPALPDLIEDSAFPSAIANEISYDRQLVTGLATDADLTPGITNPLAAVDETLDELGRSIEEAVVGDPEVDYLETPAQELADDLFDNKVDIEARVEDLQDAVVSLVEAYENGSLYPVDGDASGTYDPEEVIDRVQDTVDTVERTILPQIEDDIEGLEAAAEDELDLA